MPVRTDFKLLSTVMGVYITNIELQSPPYLASAES